MLGIPIFKASWTRAWCGLGAAGDGIQVRDNLLARYAEPHRKYHTLQHLEECLSLFESMADVPAHPAEVEMALWFHDAIYDLKSSQNEELSAVLAEKALLASGVSSDSASLVRNLILVTQHTGIPKTLDEQVLVDIDLAILGAPESLFSEYERQIRDEYAHVPGLLFRIKRKAILRAFLARAAIYNTPLLHGRLEVRARKNLAMATGQYET